MDTDSSDDGGDGDDAPGCYFDKGDHKKYHKAGTRWHPYIPPFGFSRRATCTCDANSLEVVCASKQCPELDCPRERRVRPDKLACCMVRTAEYGRDNSLLVLLFTKELLCFQVCEEVEMADSDNSSSLVAPRSDPSRPHDMASEKTDREVLDEGGCDWRGRVYGNGAAWNPRVLPYGEMKCVECKCKVSRRKPSKIHKPSNIHINQYPAAGSLCGFTILFKCVQHCNSVFICSHPSSWVC